MKQIRFIWHMLRSAIHLIRTREEAVLLPLQVWNNMVEEYEAMRDHADRLWDVIDHMNAGESACAYCEFTDRCPQKVTTPNGCKEWCLTFNEEVTSAENRGIA